jgi:hypothetical protein
MSIFGKNNLEVDPTLMTVSELEADLHDNINKAAYSLPEEELERIHNRIHELANIILKK